VCWRRHAIAVLVTAVWLDGAIAIRLSPIRSHPWSGPGIEPTFYRATIKPVLRWTPTVRSTGLRWPGRSKVWPVERRTYVYLE
jgi:hypothetical protein